MKMIMILLSFIILLHCVPSVCFASDDGTQSTEITGDDMEVNDSGFWHSVFWGTQDSPGILRSIFTWYQNLINSFFQTLVNAFLGAFNIPTQSFATVKVYFELAEQWVPLAYTFNLLFTYWVFLGVFIAVKFVLKMFPMIG